MYVSSSASPCLMDPRGPRVTQTTYLSLVTFCKTTAGIGKKCKCDVRTDGRTEEQRDVKPEIVI